MRILLATDGSTNSDAALNVVLHRPWTAGTVVRVITVVEPLHDKINKMIGLFGLGETATAAQKRYVEHCNEMLASYSGKLEAKFGKENVSVAVIEGRDRQGIVDESKNWKADTIVLGAHGHGESDEMLFGSVPDYVLTHANCSVEILRFISPGTMVTEIERSQPIEEDKYLIALDDSECSAETLEEILKRKWPAKSFFKVISVAEPLAYQAYSGLGPWEGAGSEDYARLVDKTIEAELSNAENIVANASEKLRKAFPDATVTGEVPEGYARDRILAASKEWPADLLILGSHGRRGFAELILGSVSKAVATHAPCSVLIHKVKR